MIDSSAKPPFALLPKMWVLIVVFALISGCAAGPDDSNEKQRAARGAAVGAGMGLLFGVLSGDSDVAIAATAMGAAAGAIDGSYDGYREDQENKRTQALADAIRHSGQTQSSADPDARAREELTRFLGVWSVKGWVQNDGQRRNVSASVNGTVQMSQFVEIAWVDLKIEGVNSQVWGTTMMGYDGRSGYSMSTRFNTYPDSIDAEYGRWDPAQRAFIFDDKGGSTTLSFSTPDRFTVTTRVSGNTVESYTFNRG